MSSITPTARPVRPVGIGALEIHLPFDCGSSLEAAIDCLTGPGLEALEHPETTATNAKMIIVGTMDNRDIFVSPS
jgi:hypothetical protein